MILLSSTARLALLLTAMVPNFTASSAPPSDTASAGVKRSATRAPMRRLLVATGGHAPQVIGSGSSSLHMVMMMILSASVGGLLLVMMHSADVRRGCLVVATGRHAMRVALAARLLLLGLLLPFSPVCRVA